LFASNPNADHGTSSLQAVGRCGGCFSFNPRELPPKVVKSPKRSTLVSS
jgi:hypothetical protein